MLLCQQQLVSRERAINMYPHLYIQWPHSGITAGRDVQSGDYHVTDGDLPGCQGNF